MHVLITVFDLVICKLQIFGYEFFSLKIVWYSILWGKAPPPGYAYDLGGLLNTFVRQKSRKIETENVYKRHSNEAMRKHTLADRIQKLLK